MTESGSRSDASFGGRLRWLWAEGIARRVVVEKDGRRPVDLPLTAFLVAAVLAPWLVALGGVAGIIAGYQFHVERGDNGPAGAADGPGEDLPAAEGEDSPGV